MIDAAEKQPDGALIVRHIEPGDPVMINEKDGRSVVLGRLQVVRYERITDKLRIAQILQETARD